MTSGPSKEELQDYWANNRQYFDELTKYYLEADREYYNKYIAPFYSNPFQRSPSSKGGVGKLLVILVAMIGVIAAGAVAFLVLMTGSSDDKSVHKKVLSPNVVQDSTIKPVTITDMPDTTANIPPVPISPDYDKGLKYFRNKDYKNAEKYFKVVPKGDKNYIQALKKLAEIKIIRGEDINQEPRDYPKTKDDSRKQPIERTR
jgi:hypothetical protein